MMVRHPSKQELLLYLDGEQPARTQHRTTEHLHACSVCQNELQRLREGVEAIRELGSALLGPPSSPSLPWPSLEPRMARASQAQVTPLWKRIVPFATEGLRPQLGYAVLAAAVVLFGILVLVPLRPISAKEVLQKAKMADDRRMATTPQQVIRQRVRVKKTAGASSGNQARMVSWKAGKSAYWKSQDDPVNTELAAHYQANGLGSVLPLSAVAAESWLELAGAEPSATSERDSVDVQVFANAQSRSNGLKEVQFRVARKTWQLDEMTLAFSDGTYQITEEESSVVSRSDVPRGVQVFLEPSGSSSGREMVSQSPAHGGQAPVSSASPDDLEMAVRYDLHQAGADLGDNVEISNDQLGNLIVDARRAPPEVKEQLAVALANKPGIKLQVQNPEATGISGRARTKTIPEAPTAPPPDRRLPMLFGTAEAQENYTRSVLEASSNVLSRLYALQNLAGRWPLAQESQLSRATKNLLQIMVRDHIRQLRSATSDLENRVNLLTTNSGEPLHPEPSAVRTDTWQATSTSGLQAARNADRLLRFLLTASDKPLSLDDALPPLRESLSDLEGAVRGLTALTP